VRAVLFDVGGPIDMEFAHEIALEGAIAAACGMEGIPIDQAAIDAASERAVEAFAADAYAHMIETLFGLAREGHVNAKGMPNPLQLALTAQEFSDVIVFRRPPQPLQRLVFGALTPIARRRGYRATYPSLSRTTLAPRETPA